MVQILTFGHLLAHITPESAVWLRVPFHFRRGSTHPTITKNNMNNITIFYTVLGTTKLMPWKGLLDEARNWFERTFPQNAKFAGAVLTDALTDALTTV